jgi:hypothetical protein
MSEMNIPTNTTNTTAKDVAAILLGVLGLGMAGLQNTNLLEGTGKIWMGVVVAAMGVAIALALGARRGAQVLTVILLAFSLWCALWMENKMDQQRAELQQSVDQMRDSLSSLTSTPAPYPYTP